MANLGVTWQSGRFTRNTEIVGRMDLFVYAKLSAGEHLQESKTKIVKGGKDAIVNWNERMNFTIPRDRLSQARLYVEVRDEDVTTDDIVGSGWVNLENVGAFRGSNNYQLNLDYKGEQAGVVNFNTQFA